jgi:hypothetical protein
MMDPLLLPLTKRTFPRVSACKGKKAIAQVGPFIQIQARGPRIPKPVTPTPWLLFSSSLFEEPARTSLSQSHTRAWSNKSFTPKCPLCKPLVAELSIVLQCPPHSGAKICAPSHHTIELSGCLVPRKRGFVPMAESEPSVSRFSQCPVVLLLLRSR